MLRQYLPPLLRLTRCEILGPGFLSGGEGGGIYPDPDPDPAWQILRQKQSGHFPKQSEGDSAVEA